MSQPSQPSQMVFGDIEAALVAALREVLGVPVATRVPNPRPPRFVRLTRVGGPVRDKVTDRPLIVVEAWDAAGDVAAHDLAAEARARLHALAGTGIGGVWVRRVGEVSGLSNYPDPESGTSRYQITVQLDTRGAPR